MHHTIINTTENVIGRFTPEYRDCYTDDEFKLKYSTKEKGYRYSMSNCLYESVIQNIIENCSCIPAFYSSAEEIDCVGSDLHCSKQYERGKCNVHTYVGSSELVDPKKLDLRSDPDPSSIFGSKIRSRSNKHKLCLDSFRYFKCNTPKI